jgi:hypothetical protein
MPAPNIVPMEDEEKHAVDAAVAAAPSPASAAAAAVAASSSAASLVAAAHAAAPAPLAAPRSRMVIQKMVLHNFKSYAGTKEIGPFHKVCRTEKHSTPAPDRRTAGGPFSTAV